MSSHQLSRYAEFFYNFSANIEKLAFIRKKPNGEWEVVSKKGKPLGTYKTKGEASKRLRSIEFWKHKKASLENPSLSYSAIIRLLNQEYDEKTVKQFQQTFKQNFDRLYLAGQEEPENDALEIAISSIKNFKKQANAIEMGNPEFAGKRLADLVRFLLKRVPDAQRSKALMSMRKKIYMINEYQLSAKKTPPHSSMGQVIVIIKAILLEHSPEYMRNVINAIVRNL